MTRRIVPLVFALYVASFLDRVNIVIASLRMNQDIGLSAAFGLGSGIFFLGYALFEVPSNVLLARVGARWWIAHRDHLGNARIRNGVRAGTQKLLRAAAAVRVCGSRVFPGVIYYFTHWFPEKRRARATSLLTIGIPVASMVGGPLGGALLGLNGTLGLAGWRWLYLIEGLPPIVLGLAVLRWLPDRPSNARWLPTAEREWLEAELARGNASQGKLDETVWSAMSNRTAWWLCAPYFLYIICGYAISILGGAGGSQLTTSERPGRRPRHGRDGAHRGFGHALQRYVVGSQK